MKVGEISVKKINISVTIHFLYRIVLYTESALKNKVSF